MKNIFTAFLCVLLTLSTTPVQVLAAERPVNFPPIYVSPIQGTSTRAPDFDIHQLKEEVLNQERINRDQEILVKQLSQENAALTEEVEQLQKQNPGLSKSLSDSLEILSDLRQVMLAYSYQLDERDRTMILNNETTLDLRERIRQLEAKYSQVLSENAVLEQDKKSAIDHELAQKQGELTSQYEDQMEFLAFKEKTITEQYQQLLDYKAQLIRTKEDLEKVRSNYQALIEQTKNASVQTVIKEVPVAQAQEAQPLTVQAPTDVNSAMFQETLENLKAQTIRLQQYQTELKSKDESVFDLQDKILKKDEEIAKLKNELLETKNQLTTTKEQLAASQKEVEALKALATNTPEVTPEQMATAQKELSASQEKIVKTEKELVEAKTTVSSQQEAITVLNSDLNQMKKNVGELKEKYAHYDEGFALIRLKIIELKQQLADAQTVNKDMASQKEAVEKLKATINDLSNQLKSSKEDSAMYQAQIKGLNQSLEGLKAQLKERDTQIAQFKTKEQTTLATIGELKAQVEDLSKQNVSIKALQDDLQKAKERMELYDTLVSKRGLIEQLAAQKAVLLTQWAQGNQQKSDYFKNQIKGTIDFWQSLSKSNEAQLDHIKEESKKQHARVEQMEAQVNDYKKKTIQLESMLDVYQNKADSIDQDSKAQSKMAEQLLKDLQAAQRTLEEREKELKQVKAYFYELEQRSAVKLQEIKDKNAQIAMLNLTLEQRNMSLEEKKVLQERLLVLEEKIKTSVDHLELEKSKQFIKAQGQEILDLKDQIYKCQREIDSRDMEISRLKK
jgi:chromosome segregation ATPase